MSLTKQEIEEIAEDVKNRNESQKSTILNNVTDVILDIFKNPESSKKKSGEWIYDVIIPLQSAIESAVCPISGLTAPFLIMIMEEAVDFIKSNFPVESEYVSEVRCYYNHLEAHSFDKYTDSELVNSIILRHVSRED